MRFLEALREKPLLCDGAMGTQLQQAGLRPGECGEVWSLERPDDLMAIQKRYVDAGVDCLITCTFGASRTNLAKHGRGDQTADINRAAVEVARRALGPDRFVLGDIGPLGELLEPYGTVSEAEALEVFTEQARALVAAGPDAIIIETMMSLEELLLAAQAVRAVDGRIPLIASMAYDKLATGGYATMMGVTPETHAVQAVAAGADVVACNCGASLSIADHAAIVTRFRKACDQPLMSQPNAGKPEVQGGQVVYPESPESMADQAPRLLDAGARVIGGCCGTTPEHIAAMRRRLDAIGA